MSARNSAAKQFKGAKVMPDPGNAGVIVVDQSPVICNLASTAAQTRTLALPTREGAEVTLHMQTDGGDITLTVASAYNETGDTTFVFSEVGQFVAFKSHMTSAGVYFWRSTSHHGIGNMSPTEAAALNGLTATVTELNARAAAASRIVNVTDAATYTVLAADSGKIHIMPDFTSSCTLTMPAVSAGLEYTFIGKATAADAQNWIFQGPSAVSFLGGSAFLDTDAGAGADEVHAGVFPNGSSNDFHTIVTPGAGTRIYMICDGTNWIVNGIVLSATVPTFSDT